MKTIEDMKKDLEKNPEYKKIIENKNMYFFEKWIEKKFREKAYNSLFEDDNNNLLLLCYSGCTILSRSYFPDVPDTP